MWRKVPPICVQRAALRLRLARAAVRYAQHGWPVAPGARLSSGAHSGRFVCDRPLCPTTRCHPAVEQWADLASVDAHQVRAWWRDTAYSVLLATGHRFDVLEVPAALATRAVAMLSRRDLVGPVAVSPAGGRWLLFVASGPVLHPDLAGRLDLVLHQRGSWVPAPPTRYPDGSLRWVLSPESVGWRLPDSDAVQGVLSGARTPAGTARGR